MQASAAAGDQHIDVFIHLQHFAHQRAIRALNGLYRGGRQTALLQRLLDHLHRGGVGAPGLFPAAQDRCVAGFQTQGGDVDRHVGSRFINHANHPQRDAATFNTQTAVQQPAVDHLADRIGQIAHLAHIAGDAAQTRRGQREAIKHRFTQAIGASFG